jgi:uncharacterized membrane protein YeaQ/YmgE (transglycosylase-associated protein family)
MPSSLLGTIIVGAIIGWLASIVAKTNDQMGCLWNILIGIVGAALGHWVAAKVFHYSVVAGEFSWPGFFIGIGGAVLLIVLLRAIGILRRDR